MVQGWELMEMSVETWSNKGFHKRPVATDLNQFFIGPMIFFKPGNQQPDRKRPVHK
jgi:hypothetical protein